MHKILPLVLLCCGLATQGYSQTIFSENFSSVVPPALPAGWSASFTAAPGTTPEGWITKTRASDSYWSGVPDTPEHVQYVECTEVYHTGNDPAYLLSPAFSLATASAPYLSFDFDFFDSHYLSVYEQALVDLSTDGGATWHSLDVLPGVSGWTTRYVSLAAYAGSPACQLRFEYTDNGTTLIGEQLSNVRVFNARPNDISITSVSPGSSSANYYLASSAVTFYGTMINLSPSTITSFTATYQVGGSAPVTTSVSGVSVAPMTTHAFTCTPPCTVTALSKQLVKIWVTAAGDADHTNDTMTTQVAGYSHTPVKRPVIEESTGTWCGNCPAGIITMDSLRTDVHDLVSLIAVHDGDPMALDFDYAGWIAGYITGDPTIVVDRKLSDGAENLFVDYNLHKNDFGFADMSMTASFSLADSILTVPVKVTPVTQLTGTYLLALAITEDNLSCKDVDTCSGWAQTNYYSGGSKGPLADAQYNFVTLSDPAPATKMSYNHVARSITPSPTGGAGYLPAVMAAGTTYSYTFTAPIWLGVPTPFGWVVKNLNAIAMLIDSASGIILNSYNIPVISKTGVSDITAGVAQMEIFPNPASYETNVRFELDKNTSVQIQIIDMAGRTLLTIPGKPFAAGPNVINISTANLMPGLYNLRFQTNAGIINQRMSVVK
jgi:outer membrane protein Omp28/type IX secretion system substrate protein